MRRENEEDLTTRIIYKQIQLLNKHLAVEKVEFLKIINEKRPKILLRDGSVHIFKKEELRFINEILPEDMKKILKLPIYLEISPDRFGSGVARVCGRAESYLIAKILDREPYNDEIFIYKPELRIIRKKLPTTTQYMFA